MGETLLKRSPIKRFRSWNFKLVIVPDFIVVFIVDQLLSLSEEKNYTVFQINLVPDAKDVFQLLE